MITTGEIYAHHRKATRIYKSEIQQLREKSELGEINRRTGERAAAADHEAQLKKYKDLIAKQEKARANAAEAKRVKAAQRLIMVVFAYIAVMLILWATDYLGFIDATIVKFLMNTVNWVLCFSVGWFWSIVKN